MTMADDEMEVLRLTGVTGRLEDIESKKVMEVILRFWPWIYRHFMSCCFQFELYCYCSSYMKPSVKYIFDEIRS